MGRLATQLEAHRQSHQGTKGNRKLGSLLWHSNQAQSLSIENVYGLAIESATYLAATADDFQGVLGRLLELPQHAGGTIKTRGYLTPSELKEVDEFVRTTLLALGERWLTRQGMVLIEFFTRVYDAASVQFATLVALSIPFHETPLFARLVQTLRVPSSDPFIFLERIQSSGLPLPKQVLAKRIAKRPQILRILLDGITDVIRAAPQHCRAYRVFREHLILDSLVRLPHESFDDNALVRDLFNRCMQMMTTEDDVLLGFKMAARLCQRRQYLKQAVLDSFFQYFARGVASGEVQQALALQYLDDAIRGQSRRPERLLARARASQLRKQSSWISWDVCMEAEDAEGLDLLTTEALEALQPSLTSLVGTSQFGKTSPSFQRVLTLSIANHCLTEGKVTISAKAFLEGLLIADGAALECATKAFVEAILTMVEVVHLRVTPMHIASVLQPLSGLCDNLMDSSVKPTLDQIERFGRAMPDGGAKSRQWLLSNTANVGPLLLNEDILPILLRKESAFRVVSRSDCLKTAILAVIKGKCEGSKGTMTLIKDLLIRDSPPVFSLHDLLDILTDKEFNSYIVDSVPSDVWSPEETKDILEKAGGTALKMLMEDTFGDATMRLRDLLKSFSTRALTTDTLCDLIASELRKSSQRTAMLDKILSITSESILSTLIKGVMDPGGIISFPTLLESTRPVWIDDDRCLLFVLALSQTKDWVGLEEIGSSRLIGALCGGEALEKQSWAANFIHELCLTLTSQTAATQDCDGIVACRRIADASGIPTGLLVSPDVALNVLAIVSMYIGGVDAEVISLFISDLTTHIEKNVKNVPSLSFVDHLVEFLTLQSDDSTVQLCQGLLRTLRRLAQTSTGDGEILKRNGIISNGELFAATAQSVISTAKGEKAAKSIKSVASLVDSWNGSLARILPFVICGTPKLREAIERSFAKLHNAPLRLLEDLIVLIGSEEMRAVDDEGEVESVLDFVISKWRTLEDDHAVLSGLIANLLEPLGSISEGANSKFGGRLLFGLVSHLCQSLEEAFHFGSEISSDTARKVIETLQTVYEKSMAGSHAVATVGVINVWSTGDSATRMCTIYGPEKIWSAATTPNTRVLVARLLSSWVVSVDCCLNTDRTVTRRLFERILEDSSGWLAQDVHELSGSVRHGYISLVSALLAALRITGDMKDIVLKGKKNELCDAVESVLNIVVDDDELHEDVGTFWSLIASVSQLISTRRISKKDTSASAMIGTDDAFMCTIVPKLKRWVAIASATPGGILGTVLSRAALSSLLANSKLIFDEDSARWNAFVSTVIEEGLSLHSTALTTPTLEYLQHLETEKDKANRLIDFTPVDELATKPSKDEAQLDRELQSTIQLVKQLVLGLGSALSRPSLTVLLALSRGNEEGAAPPASNFYVHCIRDVLYGVLRKWLTLRARGSENGLPDLTLIDQRRLLKGLLEAASALCHTSDGSKALKEAEGEYLTTKVLETLIDEVGGDCSDPMTGLTVVLLRDALRYLGIPECLTVGRTTSAVESEERDTLALAAFSNLLISCVKRRMQLMKVKEERKVNVAWRLRNLLSDIMVSAMESLDVVEGGLVLFKATHSSSPGVRSLLVGAILSRIVGVMLSNPVDFVYTEGSVHPGTSEYRKHVTEMGSERLDEWLGAIVMEIENADGDEADDENLKERLLAWGTLIALHSIDNPLPVVNVWLPYLYSNCNANDASPLLTNIRSLGLLAYSRDVLLPFAKDCMTKLIWSQKSRDDLKYSTKVEQHETVLSTLLCVGGILMESDHTILGELGWNIDLLQSLWVSNETDRMQKEAQPFTAAGFWAKVSDIASDSSPSTKSHTRVRRQFARRLAHSLKAQLTESDETVLQSAVVESTNEPEKVWISHLEAFAITFKSVCQSSPIGSIIKAFAAALKEELTNLQRSSKVDDFGTERLAHILHAFAYSVSVLDSDNLGPYIDALAKILSMLMSLMSEVAGERLSEGLSWQTLYQGNWLESNAMNLTKEHLELPRESELNSTFSLPSTTSSAFQYDHRAGMGVLERAVSHLLVSIVQKCQMGSLTRVLTEVAQAARCGNQIMMQDWFADEEQVDRASHSKALVAARMFLISYAMVARKWGALSIMSTFRAIEDDAISVVRFSCTKAFEQAKQSSKTESLSGKKKARRSTFLPQYLLPDASLWPWFEVGVPALDALGTCAKAFSDAGKECFSAEGETVAVSAELVDCILEAFDVCSVLPRIPAMGTHVGAYNEDEQHPAFEISKVWLLSARRALVQILGVALQEDALLSFAYSKMLEKISLTGHRSVKIALARSLHQAWLVHGLALQPMVPETLKAFVEMLEDPDTELNALAKAWILSVERITGESLAGRLAF